MVKLSMPVVKVVMEEKVNGVDELVEYTIQSDNRDMCQWDVVRGRKGWPSMSEAPVLYMTFLAWHAMYRTGATKLMYEEFAKITVQVLPVDKSGEELSVESIEDAQVNPTLPVADFA
jgi:hypothetical protein